jgi:predicted enzyme related to lactoylglutathione lyase
MSDAQLVLVIFAVQDLPRAVKFYVDAFGWERQVDTTSYVELVLPGGMRFGLYDRDGYAKNLEQKPPSPSHAITASELYVQVRDLDAATKNVIRAGARLLSPVRKRDWGDEVAYFADLDGNVVALARPLS